MIKNTNTIAITVSHLKKTYGNVKAVEDVSFEVSEGEIFGMLGPNGAGKTTTVECITGLRHPDGGTISVLGHDPQSDRDALHPIVGVQLQSSTFPDKLKVGEILDMYQSFYPNPANPEELAQALGLSEKLGSYYKTLSGGQKQRVAIARTLLKNPRILILDDSTSSVDTETEAEIRSALNSLMRGRTTFLIAHRIQSVMNADLILVLDKGQIVQAGRHLDLLAQKGIYRQIFEIQTRIGAELDQEIVDLVEDLAD